MALGFYGKLPAHGDFIERGWSGGGVQAWDDWLQRALAISREQLGERWLDHYLTSPLWRFGLSAGCIDGHHWLGVLCPSVDRVGRYFPLVIGVELEAPCQLAVALFGADDWFAGLERLALAALEQALDAEQLLAQLQALPPVPCTTMVPATSPANESVGIYCTSEPTLPQLLEWQWRHSSAAASLWRTLGSQAVRPGALLTAGMANAAGYAAMLDGDWARWGWLAAQ